MADYIEKDKAKELVCEFCTWVGTSKCEECEHPVDDVPSADVAPVRHGRWELDVLDGTPGYRPVCIVCSECHRINYGQTPYCPNCGTKMDGGNG